LSLLRYAIFVHTFLISLYLCNSAEGRGLLPGYPSIKGTVVDGATKKPIEGAVVVAQWTKLHGFGLTYHTLEKMTETQTDKNGVFAISGTNAWFVEPPEMVIYKEGFLPWRNDSIFPGGNKRKIIEWVNNAVYRLDKYDNRFTFAQIESFIDGGFMGFDKNTMPLICAELYKLSSGRRQRENTIIPLNFKANIVDSETNEPIDGAIIIASDRYKNSSYGSSDKNGNIVITGNYPMLENPPSIVVYKKGYIVQSSWNHGGVSLHPFKWHSGYVFRLKRCDIQSSWSSLDWHIGQLDEKSNQFLRNIIAREKSEK
jgi:hypothetical protein